MWRRWHNQEPTIGHPMLMDTSVDEGYLETIPEVESLRSRRSSAATALPDLPLFVAIESHTEAMANIPLSRAVPPLNEIYSAHRASHASSIYSQPSPTYPQRDLREPTPETTPGPDDISPVSTPRSSVDFAASDTSLVSPIDPTFTITPQAPQTEQQQRSHIPRPVSFATHDMPEADIPNSRGDKKVNTKWDKFTGEQTTSETGLPATLKPPGQKPVEMQYPQLKERTKQILANLRERDSAKKTPWGKQPPPVAADPLDNPPQKVPWKGASGRTTLVDPVKNTPSARKGPIQFPQRNVSHMGPVQDQARTMSPESVPADVTSTPAPRSISPDKPPQPAYQPVQQPSPRSSSPLKADPFVRMVPSQESIKPVAPLKAKSPGVMSPLEAEYMASLQSPFHSPQHSQAMVLENGMHRVPKLNDPPKPKYTFEKDSPPEPLTPSAGVRRKPIADSTIDLGPSHLEHEPESRFSWTTYATTVNESPRSLVPSQMSSSPMPPMPPLSAPLVVRKRPVSNAHSVLPFSSLDTNHSRASIISRKPVASDRNRSASVMSNTTSKSLPPTPVEIEAGDKISTMEARLEDLSRRKRNNAKINRELNESLKKNALAYDVRKRKEVEKMIANLALELDEITREEHEVGLNLHRAQKKRDREDCYENPTGLWIKRVTS